MLDTHVSAIIFKYSDFHHLYHLLFKTPKSSFNFPSIFLHWNAWMPYFNLFLLYYSSSISYIVVVVLISSFSMYPFFSFCSLARVRLYCMYLLSFPLSFHKQALWNHWITCSVLKTEHINQVFFCFFFFCHFNGVHLKVWMTVWH